MAALLAQASLLALATLVLGLPAWGKRGRRRWLALAALLVALDQLAVGLPMARPALQPFDGEWNWGGKLLSLLCGLAAAAVLIRRGGFDRRAFGLTFAQRPGTPALVAGLVLPALLLWAAALAFVPPAALAPTAETLLFEATLPGLAEELAYRGLLLAVWQRVFPSPPASFGYAAVASTLGFAVTHGLALAPAAGTLHLEVRWAEMGLPLASGCLLALCRLRSGSLLLPVAAHNAIDEISVAAGALGG